MAKIPDAVHAANIAGLEAAQPKTRKRPMAPNNMPDATKIARAYEKAEAAGDEAAMAALLDAWEDLDAKQREKAYQQTVQQPY